MSRDNYIWIKRINRDWIINIQALTAVVIYLGLFIAIVGFFLPKSWNISIVGIGICLLYPFAGILEHWLFTKHIKCPKCGFNATHGKTTNKPLNKAVAWSRLEKYTKCPNCGYTGE